MNKVFKANLSQRIKGVDPGRIHKAPIRDPDGRFNWLSIKNQLFTLHCLSTAWP